MSQNHHEKSVRFIVQDEAESLSRVDLCRRLWDGTLSFSSRVYYENRWLPLERHPSLYTGPQGMLLRIIRNLDGKSIPYCTLLLVVLLNVGSWLQEPHLTTKWAHGWSNVFLEGRWWSIGTGFIIHSSKSHFLSNIILILFLGWRVERALGTWRCFFLVCIGTWASCFSICFFEEGMVVGASSIVFTLWGAQIALGLFFSLPPRHRSRYGWWGLLLLMVVFVSQIGTEDIAHSTHIVGVWVGVHTILFLSVPLWGSLLLFAAMLGLFVQDISPEKKQDIDGMSIVIPRDFVSHAVGESLVWFHPFDTSGWVIQGQNASLVDLNEYWKKRDFTFRFTKQCALQKGCIGVGDSQDIHLRIIHLGSEELSWIACVSPKGSLLWKQSCDSWIRNVEVTEPYQVRRKRELMERYSDSEYHLEQYALTLERWGYFQEADNMYMQLLDSDWRARAEQHRNRIQQYISSQ